MSQYLHLAALFTMLPGTLLYCDRTLENIARKVTLSEMLRTKFNLGNKVFTNIISIELPLEKSKFVFLYDTSTCFKAVNSLKGIFGEMQLSKLFQNFLYTLHIPRCQFQRQSPVAVVADIFYFIDKIILICHYCF